MAKPFFWLKWLAALGHLRRFPGVRDRSAYPFKLIVAADMLNRQRCANSGLLRCVMRLSGGPGQPTKRPAPKIWGIATNLDFSL